jgi:hypothetical protein
MRDDPGFIFIGLLAALGLAWDVKIPSEEADRASLGVSGIAKGA